MLYTVNYDDQTYKTNSLPMDDLAYSTTARRHGWPTNIQEISWEYLYFTAYEASKRDGIIDPNTGFKSFMDRVKEIIPEAEEDNEDMVF